MSYTNSPLVSYTKLSPNHSGQRTHSIDRISPHCVVGQCTVETLGNIFAPTSREASSNYGIGKDGRVAMYVEEKNRSWCTSSNANDQRAITIEVASDTTHPYAMKDAAYNSLVDLCEDICKRNGKTKLLWFADKNRTLNYTPNSDEMIITVHRWFANKSCPGDWLYSRLGKLAEEVTKRLSNASSNTNPSEDGKVLYKVQIGAFSKEANAKNLAATLKADSFDTHIIKEGGLWKVQTGAYSKKPNAQAQVTKLQAMGYEAIIKTVTTGTPVNASTSTPTKNEEPKVEVVAISKGDIVTVKPSAKTYTGGGLASFVYKTKYTVLEDPKGDRVVIGLDGKVTAAVNAKDLTVVKKANGTSVGTQPAASATPAAPKKTEFHKGDKVTVNQGAKTYTGGGLASFVYNTTYTVVETPKGDRVVIGINGKVTAAVNAKDLKHK